MLPYDKYWLSHEMHEIESQRKRDKYKKKDTEIMFKWLLCLCVCFVSLASATDYYIFCPHCSEVIHMEIVDLGDNCVMTTKKGKWKCPKCNYENDNRIRYCGVCGSERQ